MIERYLQYLSIIDKKIGKMFERQKPFIKCKKGCAYCCKEGKYPLSELEYVNLMFYFQVIDEKLRNVVIQNIKKLLENETIPDSYECPFLVNNSCSVYQARPLICRAFGLLTYYENNKMIPFCVDRGLNYAEYYDKKERKITKVAEDGTEPVAFNIDRRTLRSEDIANDFKIYFGEDKALFDWLKEDFNKRRK